MILSNAKKKKRIVIVAKSIKETKNQEKEKEIDDDNSYDGVLTDEEMRSIFNAKCQDFRLKADEKMYKSFKIKNY